MTRHEITYDRSAGHYPYPATISVPTQIVYEDVGWDSEWRAAGKYVKEVSMHVWAKPHHSWVRRRNTYSRSLVHQTPSGGYQWNNDRCNFFFLAKSCFSFQLPWKYLLMSNPLSRLFPLSVSFWCECYWPRRAASTGPPIPAVWRWSLWW